jgi:tetratricopeptide (TPR) repeat protein
LLLASIALSLLVPGGAAAQAGTSDTPDLAIFRAQRLRQIPARERDEALEEYVLAVRAALDAGENEAALQMATRATELWKRLRRPWLHRSAAELALRQWGPSIASAREARKARDDSMRPEAHDDETEAAASYWEGLGLYQTQRYDEALPRLLDATERAAEWAEAWRAYAEALFVSGDDAAAGAIYAKALALDPQLGSARDLSYYAEATAANGDLDSAIAAMQEALRRYPYDAGLHANLGRMFREEGDLVEAYYYFTMELLLQGTSSRFASKALEATTDILVALNDHPGHPSRHELLQVSQGLSHLREGQAHQAAHFFKHAASISRSSTPVPRLLLAEALLRGGEFADSRRELEAILAEQPDFVPALALLSEALHELGEREQAHLTRKQAESLFPSYWRLRATPQDG